ncbi:MAG: hypothetical protein RJA49_666 [Actinomycetota bacterium]|jgi:hypothetical protein
MIDHLVVATPDVAATAAYFADEWGVDLAPGGSHVGRGTRNELTGLGGARYLEVVGPDEMQPVPSHPRPFGVDDLRAPALVAWCARPTRPLPEVIASCRALGIDLGNASPMARRRPDGVLLQWHLTVPLLGPPHEGAVPFLIDWLDSPHPSASLPHHCALVALRLRHPQADLLTAVLGEIGDALVVEVATGDAELGATVRTPHGLRDLEHVGLTR